MITDARVFDTRDFVPGREMVVARHDQISALSKDVESFLDGFGKTHTLITGPTGSGKTCVARVVLEELRRERLGARTSHVDCWQHHSDFAFIASLLEGIGRPVGLDERNVRHDELLRRLRDDDERPYVVVLDEVDQLDNLNVLHDIYRIDHVYPIMICNRETDLFSRFEARSRSRWGVGQRLRLSSYSLEEIRNILQRRASYGLQPETVSDGVLERVADESAGDARLAIESLKHAALVAADQEDDVITADLVPDAIENAREDVRQKTLSSLNRDQRILYQILEEYGRGMSMGELDSEYHSRVSNPKSTRTLRRYLQKMQHYNLIEVSGEKRGRKYSLR
jgi:Cdc6-like AAA superfamily ATPase